MRSAVAKYRGRILAALWSSDSAEIALTAVVHG
jgi:hypothetical protein